MPKQNPVRKGKGPRTRPTEWTSAIVMLVAAFTAWQTDHDTAALLAVVAACIPAITTAITTWWESRQAS